MKNTLAVSAALLFAANVAGAATISTLSQENSLIAPWGLPNTAAYGQTFTLGAADTLDDVTFRINDRGTAISYDLLIYGWTGATATGAALASVSGSTAGVNAMSSVTTSAGGVSLSAGSYVALLQATSAGSSNWGSVSGSDAYAGGAFVYQNNGGDVSQLVGGLFNSDHQGPGYDLAFEMNFGGAPAVPLPAALPLLLAGFGAMGLMGRRKA